MKKQLLIAGLVLGSIFTSNAQLLQSENFNSLTIGNVGTDLTGTTAGQGSFYTYNTTTGGTNSANTNFQIVADDATHIKALQITGSDAATGAKYIWKNGLDAAWATRTTGNNVIELEFSIFTGPVTTSTSTARAVIYSDDTTPATVGHAIGGYVFNQGTKRLDGYAFGDFNNTGTPGNYTITLKTGGLFLPANTWVKIGFAYDSTTGTFTWVSNDVSPAIAGSIDGEAGYGPAELDFLSVAGTANAVAPVSKFDDYTVKATPLENLLSVKNDLSEITTFSVYPNPTSGIVNISASNDVAISAVSLTDLNGRIVKQSSKIINNQINISDLSAGVYMMNISSDQGSVVKKIVKN